MWTSWRRMLIAGLAAGVVLVGLANVSQAQVMRVSSNRMAQFQPFINPNFQVAPGLTISQQAFNIRTLGRAYQTVPPWVYGYNPYPPIYTNYGPIYRSPVYYSPPMYTPYSAPIYTPYYSAPIAPVYNPYGYNLYNPYFP